MSDKSFKKKAADKHKILQPQHGRKVSGRYDSGKTGAVILNSKRKRV